MLASNILILFFGVAAILAGVGFVVRGAIGRRDREEESCRRCGYVLEGLGEPARCPECGSDLTPSRAVRRFSRRRSPGAIVAGLLLVVIGIGPVGLFTWYRVQGTPTVAMQPTWLLMLQDGALEASAEEARHELARRIDVGLLSDSSVAGLVERSLDRLQVREDGFSTGGRAVLEAAWFNGHLDEDQTLDWLRASVEPAVDLRTRPVVRHGQRLPVQLAYSGNGFTSTFQQRLAGRGDDLRVSLRVDDIGTARLPEHRVSMGGAAQFSIASNGAWGSTVSMPLESGAHRISGVALLEIVDGAGATILEWEAPVAADTDVVTRSGTLIESDHDPAAGQEVHDAVRIVIEPDPQVVAPGSSYRFNGAAGVVFIGPEIPLPVAFSVAAWTDGARVDLGDLVARPGVGGHLTISTDDHRALLEGGSIAAIELSPSVDVAERTIDLRRIHGATVLIEGVDLADSATAPDPPDAH